MSCQQSLQVWDQFPLLFIHTTTRSRTQNNNLHHQVPYTYLGSFLFSSHSKAQNLWLFHNFILGILGPMAIFLVSNPDKQKIVLIFMRFFPQISFAYSLIWLGFTNALEGVDGGDDDDGAFESFDPFIEPIRTSLIYMACEAVGYTVIVLLLER